MLSQRTARQQTVLPDRGPEVQPSALAGLGIVIHLNAQGTLFREGDPATQVYRIVSGMVRLYRLSPGGRRQIVRFAAPGDVLALADGGTHSVTAEAVNDAAVIAYRRTHLTTLCDGQPALKDFLADSLRRDLQAAEAHVILLGRLGAVERIALFLLEHADAGGRVQLPMGRQDMADYLGLTIETVSRSLSALRRDGIIEISGRHGIAIRDRAAIARAAEGE